MEVRPINTITGHSWLKSHKRGEGREGGREGSRQARWGTRGDRERVEREARREKRAGGEYAEGGLIRKYRRERERERELK